MIRAAIVGTGNIAHFHAESLLTFPKLCQIVALVDIYPDKAERFLEEFDLKDAKVYESCERMLASGQEIDLVHICTPPSSHAELAIQCMRAKKNVLVEKPMAPSIQECEEMLRTEKEYHVTMGCVAQNRFRNSIYKLKKVLDSGLAGTLRVAHVNSLWWRGHSYYDLWWRGTWEREGGGPTLNHAVHHIDMINWIHGELPTEVISLLANVMHDNSEVEDISFAALKYEDGSVGEVTSSVVHHGEEQGIVLQCERAKISAPWSCAAEIERPNGFPEPEHDKELMEKLEAYYRSLPDLEYEGHTGLIRNVLLALEAGERPMITGDDGKRTVELITAIYQAGFEKRAVSLPIRKTDSYYTAEGLISHAVHFYEKSQSVENFGVDNFTVGNY